MSTHPSGSTRIADIEANLPKVAGLDQRAAKPERRSITQAYADYAGALAGRDALVCYAVKANSNQAVLATCRAHHGTDACLTEASKAYGKTTFADAFASFDPAPAPTTITFVAAEIGRASCRERV